ncbi:hypothetical protein OCD90_10855 [Bacillus pacificus]|uniref:hypothetical protein n=1 Tax=Bacillus cereus group TaxID=86661 RepID=UPI000BEBC346|nr:hypothetical protein [Bacillus pacificus]MCU5256269.1 hypothetical protein [Bacillus pacificus]PEF56741.1 hypothetical protein CON32_18640 [Bacillus cereus]
MQMATIDKTVISHLGDLFKKTNVSILAAEIGSGAPVLLQNLIEQNNWKTKFLHESQEWFDFSNMKEHYYSSDAEIDADFSIFVMDDTLSIQNIQNELNLFLTNKEKVSFIKQTHNNFHEKHFKLFQSIIDESQKNKVIILTTKSIAPVFDGFIKDYTLVLCEHPILTISVGQTINEKTNNYYDSYHIK